MKSTPNHLIEVAWQATLRSYVPYSAYAVGAALLTEDGMIIAGCNIENASYGLSMCAERVALYRTLAEGHNAFRALAVVAEGDAMPYPCGACRQVLAEFAPPDMRLFVARCRGVAEYEEFTLGELLPRAFVVPPVPENTRE